MLDFNKIREIRNELDLGISEFQKASYHPYATKLSGYTMEERLMEELKDLYKSLKWLELDKRLDFQKSPNYISMDEVKKQYLELELKIQRQELEKYKEKISEYQQSADKWEQDLIKMQERLDELDTKIKDQNTPDKKTKLKKPGARVVNKTSAN